MKKAAIAGLLLSAIVSGDVRAQSQDAEVEKVSSTALSGFVASWNRAAGGDSLGYAQYRALYWPDADLVDPSGNVWNDQNGIVQMHVDLWNAPFKGSVVEGKLRKARRLSSTVLVADFDLTLKLAGPPPLSGPGAGGPVKAHLKMVMMKRGSEWRTISSQNTFFSDSAPPVATELRDHMQRGPLVHSAHEAALELAEQGGRHPRAVHRDSVAVTVRSEERSSCGIELLPT